MIVLKGNLEGLIKETQTLSIALFRLNRKLARVVEALSKTEIDLRTIKRLQEELTVMQMQMGITLRQEC